MTVPLIKRTLGFFALLLAGSGMAWCAAPTQPAAAAADTSPAPTPSVQDYRHALQLVQDGNADAALTKVAEAIQEDPSNVQARILRGDLYVQKKLWDDARKDFLAAQSLDPQNTVAKFDLAEIQLMQKQFDVARPAFDALVKDPDMGDLAAYKVFLCDLYGGHADDAARELQAFDAVGKNASYYYAHVAWALYNKRTDEARRWLSSALYIYPAQKSYNYASTLKDFGYLPLPPG